MGTSAAAPPDRLLVGGGDVRFARLLTRLIRVVGVGWLWVLGGCGVGWSLLKVVGCGCWVVGEIRFGDEPIVVGENNVVGVFKRGEADVRFARLLARLIRVVGDGWLALGMGKGYGCWVGGW